MILVYMLHLDLLAGNPITILSIQQPSYKCDQIKVHTKNHLNCIYMHFELYRYAVADC